MNVKRNLSGGLLSGKLGAMCLMLALFADAVGLASRAVAAVPTYIPTAVPTATSTLYTGAATISPGRVAVDSIGNVFYVGHVSGSTGTLYELPATSPTVAVVTPTALLSGLGQFNANSAFVDATGTLWVSNGNGAAGSLIEIPALNGIPNVAAITGASGYGATGLALSGIATACTAASTAPCIWSASSIASNLSNLQIADIYSDGAGNVSLVDMYDSVSAGAYNRVIRFKTSAAGSITVLADNVASNSYAQVTVAGDGKPYYCDTVTGRSSGGLVSVINGGSLTTVGNLPASSLTLLNAIVEVPAATGVTSDPWGNLIITGAKQISEIPLENGIVTLADQFNLLVAVSGSNAPMATNNALYGGTFDVHGSYYYASATNIMQVQVGGYNFGKVNVGTEVTTAAPFLTITWDVPSQLVSSGAWPTASPSTLSAANAAYLQSFPYSGQKNFFGGTPYAASNTGQYVQMYFQPVHAGLLRGSFAPQGYPQANTALGSTHGIYTANLQGVGVGPQPTFVPGTASKAVGLSQLYTTVSHTTKANGFSPVGVALDSLGDIFIADTAAGTLDISCLATTANTSAANASYCQANGVGFTFALGGTSFVAPSDVVLDGGNDVYVLDSAASATTVTKFSYNTMIPVPAVPSGTIVAGTALSNPKGLAIDGYSNLYIADTGNNRIVQGHQYNAQYAQNIVFIPNSKTFGGITLSQPTGLGLDSSGNLFIADTGNRRIVEYSVTGVASVITTTGVTLVSPTSVKVLPSGSLVVADSTLGLVLVTNGAGSLLSTGSLALSGTQGLALDLAGNIYVADPAGAQVVTLNTNSPATATPFPDTLRGSATSTETSYIYNSGNSPLTFSASPTVVDNSGAIPNEFKVDPSNVCTAATSVPAGSSCSMIMDFTPVATAPVYTQITGTATVANNLQSYTLVANAASTTQDIGVFGTTGSTQRVALSGYPTVPMTPQTITFTTPVTSVTFSATIPPITLSATGGASGLPVIFSIVSGKGTLSGANNSILTVTDIGTTVIAATQAGGLSNGVYYAPATRVTQQIVVNPIGTVATPTFSVASGTYTAAQSVNISESTPGATVYYTTNGNTPTISSPVYTAGTAIPITITSTIKAIAVETGYTTSALASATYTLNPDFALSAYVSTFNIPNGLDGSTRLAIAPLFGFNSTVNLTCSGLSTGDTCSITPSSVKPANGITEYATLAIQTKEVASAEHRGLRPFAPVATLAAFVCLFGFRKRNRLRIMMLLVLSVAGASMVSGCAAPAKTHTSTFTVTASSGSILHTATMSLIVNNL